MTVGADESRKVTGGRTTNIGKDDATKVAKNFVVDAGDSVTIKTGERQHHDEEGRHDHHQGQGHHDRRKREDQRQGDGDIVMKGSKIGKLSRQSK